MKKHSLIKYKSYIEFCQDFKNNPEIAQRNLAVQNWIVKRVKNSHSLEFDNNLDDFCLNYNLNNEEIEDSLDYVLSFSRSAILQIINNPNEKLIREEIFMPISKVKEISSKGVMWLTRKPGKTLKQKIKNTTSILAVKRRMSMDTTENRLFVTYLNEIYKLLQYKITYNDKIVSKIDKMLYEKIGNFLRNSEISEIKKWENLPPNNTLLSDKNYRKVWDSWIALKKIDQIVENISNNLVDREKMIEEYNDVVRKSKNNNRIQVPLLIDYDNYKIEPLKKIVMKNDKISYKKDAKISKDVNFIATNLLSTSTSYYCKNGYIQQRSNIIEQAYKVNNKEYLIPCSYSNYIYMDDDNITTHTILTELDIIKAEKLQKLMQLYKESVNCDSISFVIPDAFDDIKMINLNKISRINYKEIKIIPKSIAALYGLKNEKNFFKAIEADKTNVLVFDIIGKKITYTLLKAKENEKIKDKDNFNSILWERIVTNYINSSEIFENFFLKIKNILGVKDIENLKKIYSLNGINGLVEDFKDIIFKFKEEEISFNNKKIKEIKSCKININKEMLENILSELNLSVNNLEIIMLNENLKLEIENKNYTINEEKMLEGCYNHFQDLNDYKNLSVKFKDLTFWQDYLPNLGIRQIIGQFILTNNQKIIPIIGKEKEIEINGEFILPKNNKEYKFDLLKKDIYEKEYQIILNSSNFPLDEDLSCKLHMVYKYGSEEPIKLVFKPINKKYKSINAEWKLKSVFEYKDLFIPKYPNLKEEFLTLDKILNQTLEKIIDVDNLKINNNLFIDNGNCYYIADRLIKKINSKYIAMSYNVKKVGFKIKEKKNRYFADSIFPSNVTRIVKDISNNFELTTLIKYNFLLAGLHNIFLNDGKISDNQLINNDEFKNKFEKFKGIISYMYNENENIELLKIMAIANKEFKDAYYNLLTDEKILEISKEMPYILGYSLGNLENENQINLYNKIKKICNGYTLIKVLSISIWRNEKMIYNIPKNDLLRLFDKVINKFIENPYCMYLDFIYGVFRLREKEDEEILMKLSKNNPNVLKLQNFLQNNKKIKCKSRLKFEFKNKPEEMHDLAYAVLVCIFGKTDEEIIIKGIENE